MHRGWVTQALFRQRRYREQEDSHPEWPHFPLALTAQPRSTSCRRPEAPESSGHQRHVPTPLPSVDDLERWYRNPGSCSWWLKNELCE